MKCKTCDKRLTTSNAYIRENGRFRTVCRKCHNERTYKNLKAWRRRTKKRAVEYMGGSCTSCGYNKCDAAMIFHHPGEKSFGIGSGSKNSWARIEKELGKCVLLCLNCHAEDHHEELTHQ